MFVVGQEYQRRVLHEKFHGQQQGGISTPQKEPFILLFTGESGAQYGYKDGWDSNSDFLYTGEGQTGDMTFVRGNRAIRDHFEDGKDLHLFRYVTKGRVRYEGQMVYTGFEFRQGPDVEGKERKIIVFRLTPIEAFSEIPRQDETIHKLIQEETLADLRQAAAHHSNETPSKSTRNVTVYERSLAIKAYTRKRAEGMCEACRTPAPFVTSSGDPYIEIHHLRRLSDGGPDNPEWVIGVCPNCHRRAHYGHDGVDFNKHLIEVVRSIEKRAISL